MQQNNDFDDLFEGDRSIPYNERNISSAMGSVRRQLFFRTRGPAIAVGGLIFAMLVLASVFFFSMTSKDDMQAVPIIQADAQPYRVLPDDPGGMAIPHRDSTVFSSLRSKQVDGDDDIENLFAEEVEREEALPRSQLFAGLNTEEDLNGVEPAAGTEEILNEGMNETESLFGEAVEDARAREAEFMARKESVSSDASTQEIAEAVEKDMQKLDDVKLVVQQEPEVEAVTPAPKPAPQEQRIAALQETPKSDPIKATESTGTHFVQLGAVKSATAAETGWGSFSKEYGSILSGADHRVERADLGEKGVYFRIQAGPYSKADAAAVCDAIKAQKPGGCLVVAK